VIVVEKTTEEIIRELKRGQDREHNAHLLFQRYFPWVYGYFRNKGFLPQDCEELAEDVFFSVYIHVGTLRHETKFECWMSCIAVNVYRDELDRRQAQKRAAVEVSLEDEAANPEGVNLPAPVADPEGKVLEREKMEKVQAVVDGMPDQMRQVVMLRAEDEMTYEEIGAVLGISANTVSAHLHQARRVLREHLSQYFGQG
jgi:RNA polymerase sigma-70 factor (ECF subfamily)